MELLPRMHGEARMNMVEMIDRGLDARILADIVGASRRCAASKPYVTEWRASRAVENIERMGGDANPYKCPVCGRWHVDERRK